MRKLKWIAITALVGLTAAGVAVAVMPKGISSATATFDTTKAAQTKTKTCTGADGTYELTKGVYTGTATGALAGNVRIRFHSTVNTTEDLGLLKGKLTVRSGGEGSQLKAKANLTAVINNGNVSGFLTGRVRDAGALLANFSANLSGNDFDGQLGSGSATNTAILFAGTGCGKVTQQNAAAATTEHGKGKHKGHGKP